jgi:hypothetical protein
MMELKKMPVMKGCLFCNYRTDDPIEIAAWNGCPNCKEAK